MFSRAWMSIKMAYLHDKTIRPGKNGKQLTYQHGVRLSISFALLCCLLLIFSGCASLFSGVTGSNYKATPVIKSTPTPTLTSVPVTDSDLARSIVQGMTLNQKLGQMVIVEFYGATLNAD